MPYPNFHSARVKNPGLFSTSKEDWAMKELKGTRGIMIVLGKLKGAAAPSDPTITQSYRFPKDKYTVAEAKAWLKRNKIKYILFEKATEE